MFVRALIAASALTLAPAAYAADQVAHATPGVVEAANPSIYVQLLGGVALGDATTFVDPPDSYNYELQPAAAVAGAIGVVLMDGLSIEGEIFYSKRDYDPDVNDLGNGYTWTSTSVMANLKYTFALSDTLGIYAAAGLGMIYGSDYYPPSDPPSGNVDYSGLGYQFILGASAEVADKVSVIGELRYQDSFEPLDWEEGYGATEDISTTSVLTGVKFGF